MTERRRYAGMLAHPAAEMMPLLDADAARALAADIKANGLRVPIILLDGQILDGRNRAAACEEAGVRVRTEEAPPGINPWRYVWSLNAERRHLTASQRPMIVIEMMRGSDAWEADKKRREDEANANRSKGKAEAVKTQPRAADGRMLPAETFAPVQTSRPAQSPRPVDTSRHEHVRVAEAAGVSPRQAASALAVAKKAPEMVPRIVAGEITIKDAEGLLKQQAKRELAAKLDAAPIETPEGPFEVIVADPPWCYTKRSEDLTHRARLDYPDMTQDQILALPVPKLAGPDCVLWLWTTNAFMHDALHCIEAWGFTQKTILTWAKDRMGTGDWLRGQTEHCILAVRGKPLVTLTNQTTILNAPLREHSRKPDEFFALVGKLCHGRKLEMFSREKREGWAAWGGELEKFNK